MDAEHIQYVPINSVTFGTNVRQNVDEQGIEGLALTIREFGIQQPIRVRPDGDKLKVIFGHRRVLAAKRAGLTTVPVIIEDRSLSNGEVIERQLIENLQKKSLSPSDAAYGIKELQDETGCTEIEVAKRLGLSPGSISKLLSILSLPSEALKKVQSGEIAASTAYEISKVQDVAKQIEIAEQVANSQLTRTQTCELVRRENNGAPRASEPQVMCAKADLGSGRSVTVRGSGLTLENFICWLEELLAKARKGRTKALELKAFLKGLKEQSLPNESKVA